MKTWTILLWLFLACSEALADSVSPTTAAVGEAVSYTVSPGTLPLGTISIRIGGKPALQITKLSSTQVRFQIPELLGGLQYIYINGLPKAKLNVLGKNFSARISDNIDPSRYPTSANEEILLIKLCGARIDPQTIKAQIDQGLTAAESALPPNYKLKAKGDPTVYMLGGDTAPCNCILVEQIYSVQSGGGRIAWGAIINILKKFLFPEVEQKDILPLFIYSPQSHYNNHPGPDHDLKYSLNLDNVPWKKYSLDGAMGTKQLPIPNVSPTRVPKEVWVAILDSGLDENIKSRISNNVLPQKNFTGKPPVPDTSPIDNSVGYHDALWIDYNKPDAMPLLHGSPIARIISQLARNATIVPVKVCTDGNKSFDSRCTETSVIRGMCYVVNQAKELGFKGKIIFNLSLSNYNYSPILRDVVDYVTKQGALIVTVAANSGWGDEPAKATEAYQQGAVAFPAGYALSLPLYVPSYTVGSPVPNLKTAGAIQPVPAQNRKIEPYKSIVGVGSVTEYEPAFSDFAGLSVPTGWQPSHTSVWGEHVTLSAPGRIIVQDGGFYSGTSFAAAFVSGYVAALWGENAGLSATALVSCVKQPSHVTLPTSTTMANVAIGKGVLNLKAPLICP